MSTTIQPWLTYVMEKQYGSEPDGVQALARDVGNALLALASGSAGSAFQLPVRFYNGNPPGPTQVGWYFDDNTAVPGWTGVWLATNATAPTVGNGALLWKNDNTVIQLGSAAVGLLLIPVESEFTAGVVAVGNGFFLNSGAFISGSGQPWKQAVSALVDLTGGGTVNIDTPTTDNPIVRFSGTLPGDTTVVIVPNIVGATWDFDFSDLDLNGHNIRFQTGAATKPIIVPSTVNSGARIAVVALDTLSCFGMF